MYSTQHKAYIHFVSIRFTSQNRNKYLQKKKNFSFNNNDEDHFITFWHSSEKLYFLLYYTELNIEYKVKIKYKIVDKTDSIKNRCSRSGSR